MRGRCLSVEVQPWSAWPTEPKRPHGTVRRMEIVRKEHSKGGINVSEHERICGFRRYCSDVWEHTSCTCAHTCAHVKDFQPNFYKPYGTFVPDFCIPSGKRKVAENWRNEVVWRSYGMQYLHTYSFNIKGFFWYHVRKLTNIQCTDVGNEFPVWLVFHLFLTKMSSKVEQQCIVEWTLQTLLQPKKQNLLWMDQVVVEGSVLRSMKNRRSVYLNEFIEIKHVEPD